MVVNQYEVVWVNLDPTIGSEIKKTRPCVIISPNEMNKHLEIVIVAPITSKSKNYPTRVQTKIEGKQSCIVIDQIRTIDKKRITKKSEILSEIDIKKIKQIIKETFVD